MASRIWMCTGLQQQGHHGGFAQARGFMERAAAVAALLVDLGALQEQQLHQVDAVRANGCEMGEKHTFGDFNARSSRQRQQNSLAGFPAGSRMAYRQSGGSPGPGPGCLDPHRAGGERQRFPSGPVLLPRREASDPEGCAAAHSQGLKLQQRSSLFSRSHRHTCTPHMHRPVKTSSRMLRLV